MYNICCTGLSKLSLGNAFGVGAFMFYLPRVHNKILVWIPMQILILQLG